MKEKKATLKIKGMHCPSCEILVTDKFSEVNNVKSVKANFRNQTAEVEYLGQLNKSVLNEKIKNYGYQIVENKDQLNKANESWIKRMIDFIVIAIFFVALYFFAKELKLIPETNFSSHLNYLTVFLLGLVASTSTCMATSGVLFLSTIGKLETDKTVPTISFNLGRILSYGFFGFAVGIIGKAFAYNLGLSLFLTLAIAIFMIAFGLDLAGIYSFKKIISQSFTKNLFKKFENRLINKPRKTAFFLGAITYLLPCGFTQAVQVYALGLADPFKSSLTMIVFALGTLPALMAIGFVTSLTKKTFYPYFLKMVGVLVVLIGITYISNFLILKGISFSFFNYEQASSSLSLVKTEQGKQIIKMTVDSSGYYPNDFTVKKGMPVKWIIDGKNVFGCQGFFVVPKLNIQKSLDSGQNIFEFTPQESGVINFSCGMGMYRGQITVE